MFIGVKKNARNFRNVDRFTIKESPCIHTFLIHINILYYHIRRSACVVRIQIYLVFALMIL